jgi:hypothetical protein
MTWWQYGALLTEWNERQARDEVTAPSAADYYADLEALQARNDPTIRLH